MTDSQSADDTDIEPTDTTLTIRRTVDAPRERVFAAWTEPEQVDRWWGPEGFTTTTEEMDVSPGGDWRFAMVGPDGEAYQNRLAYDEVERPERLAYTHGEPDGPEPFRVTVQFADAERDDGEATTLTMEIRYPSVEDREDAVEFGADEGAIQLLDTLVAHLGGRREEEGEE